MSNRRMLFSLHYFETEVASWQVRDKMIVLSEDNKVSDTSCRALSLNLCSVCVSDVSVYCRKLSVNA